MRTLPISRLPRVPAWAITALLGAAYVIVAPSSADLAAASYRSWLFAHHGFTLWDSAWYGGHHLLAYSVLAPALGALLGPRLLAALAGTVATALFTILLEDRTGRHTRLAQSNAPGIRLASLWFALVVGLQLLSGRIPFDLGVPFALGALLCLRRRRIPAAALLCLLSSISSPVDGAFLALSLFAWGICDASARRPALALLLVALVPIGLLDLAFPEAGSEPFAASSFWPALAATLALAGLFGTPSRTRRGPPQARSGTLRAGALLYALALIASFVLATAMGGNAVRLGTLLAGPLAALELARSRPRLLLAIAPLLLYWQLVAPVSDLASALGDPSVAASYYQPLLRRLHSLDPTDRPMRIEVVPTRDHWETRWVAPRYPIARGWERQLDRAVNPIFYRPGPLGQAAYRSWLHTNAISYVALPAAPLDYSGRAEAALLRRERLPPYLREVWHSAHWRLFAIRRATPLVRSPAVMTSLSTDSFALRAPRPGSYLIRIRYTPYWAITRGSGCLLPAPGDWTELHLARPGLIDVGIDFAPDRIRASSPRCTSH